LILRLVLVAQPVEKMKQFRSFSIGHLGNLVTNGGRFGF
jgi:hypothetical protein